MLTKYYLPEEIATIKNYLQAVRYDCWNYMGDRNRFIRQDFMSLLMGKKTPISKSGVTALQKKLLELFPDLEYSCNARIPAALENEFEKYE